MSLHAHIHKSKEQRERAVCLSLLLTAMVSRCGGPHWNEPDASWLKEWPVVRDLAMQAFRDSGCNRSQLLRGLPKREDDADERYPSTDRHGLDGRDDGSGGGASDGGGAGVAECESEYDTEYDAKITHMIEL